MKHLALLALLPLTLACAPGEQQIDAEVDATASELVADQVVPRQVYSVECGCRIDGVKKCGNYVSLEGTYLEIAKQDAGAELGVMEWCGTPGAEAECEGEVADGAFIATYIKTVTN